jgi:hypothetical protein
MVRHYKYKVLVDMKCADELAASDFMEQLRLPENERPNPTQQQVPDQGTVTQDYGFFFGTSSFDTGKFRMTAEPRVGQPPTVEVVVPPAPTILMDLVTWDSWAHGPNLIGSTYNDPVNPTDTLYISFGSAWVNIDWTKMQVGQRIQIWSTDGVTRYQDWTATAAFIAADPGGHVDVSMFDPASVGLSAGTPIQCVWGVK